MCEYQLYQLGLKFIFVVLNLSFPQTILYSTGQAYCLLFNQDYFHISLFQGT